MTLDLVDIMSGVARDMLDTHYWAIDFESHMQQQQACRLVRAPASLQGQRIPLIVILSGGYYIISLLVSGCEHARY